MTGAPSGFLGRVAADRPLLATAVLAIGMTALCIVGVRRAGAAVEPDLILGYILNAAYGVGAPVVLAAFAPRKTAGRLLFAALVALAAGGLAFASIQGAAPLPGISPPPVLLTATFLGLFVFLLVLAPFFDGAFRLGALAPFASILGVAGAAGVLALETLLPGAQGAAAAAVALAAGATIGAGVSADFSIHFARGANAQTAAAAGGHAAIAPSMFAVLTVAALFALQTLSANFGAVAWSVLWGGAASALFAATVSLVIVTASLSLSARGERIAVEENRRRQWFAAAWRPVRRALPASSALAGAAIAGVAVVVALFEAGLAAPFSILPFLAVIWAAAALVFVSLRTSVLIAVILFASTALADYAYAMVGYPAPALLERLCALTLTAIALGQLTVSWRNAGDLWRNARDIAQNAMSDGLRRFLMTLGTGAASLIVTAHSFGWAEGYAAVAYFLATGAVSLLLAPVLMVAMSAKAKR